jgi:hypothetical protein
MYGNNQADERAARRLDCPAHSFETHAYARETGIMYGDNRADERAARRWECPAHSFETHAYARETGIMYGDNRADERAARRWAYGPPLGRERHMRPPVRARDSLA